MEGGTLLLSDSHLTQNFFRNLFVGDGTATIISSEIDNSEFGILQTGGTLTMSQSSVHDNGSFGSQNISPNIMNASNNWWGSSSGPFHPTLNPTGTGNAVSDNVDFIPFLIIDPIGGLP